VGTGYWKKPEADDFRDGWWYSGDIVRVDEEGFLYVIDRKKDMILSGGTNIYPREVEDVLSTHPAIHIVAVVGVPDDKWGESVKAVVVLRDGENVSGEEIIEWCKDKMASYKKPKSIDVIPLEEMPLMGGGYKVLRRELRDRYRKQYEEQKQGKVESWGAV
jgi:acyl-CoA synthetase (AMP-forming)/AMP-acid ligase II